MGKKKKKAAEEKKAEETKADEKKAEEKKKKKRKRDPSEDDEVKKKKKKKKSRSPGHAVLGLYAMDWMRRKVRREQVNAERPKRRNMPLRGLTRKKIIRMTRRRRRPGSASLCV